MGKKFLIVHLVSNGDCLMVTAIAQQIKHDNPSSHITWAISYKCKQVILNNPYIDDIWEVHYSASQTPFGEVWEKIKFEAENRKTKGEFHEIIYSQIYPDNTYHYDGSTRSSIFRCFKTPITVNVTPVIQLYNKEIIKVANFAKQHALAEYKHVVLCECSPSSNQSFMSLSLMLELAEEIISKRGDIIFILSTHLEIKNASNRIIDASKLTYRENAELSKYCTLFIGCSSGITWLLTSNWSKKIPTIQFLSIPKLGFAFASVVYDFEYWGLDSNHIIETDESKLPMMQNIIYSSLDNFESARLQYHKALKPNQQMLKGVVGQIMLDNTVITGYKKAVECVNLFAHRNKIGWTNKLQFYCTEILPRFVYYIYIRKVKK